MRLFLARNAFPLAVGAVAVAVSRPVLSASAAQGVRRQHSRCLRQELHAGELHQHAVEPVLPQRPDQQPDHRGGGLRVRRAGRRAVRLLPRAAADRRQAGAARARRVAAGAAVVRRRLCAGAAVRPLRHRDRRAAIARHSVRVDLRREGHHRRLHAHALSLRRAAGHRRVQVDRRLGRGGGAKSRLLARAHAAHRHAAAGAAVDPRRRACWCSSRRWRISACRSCSPRTADPVGRGLQAVRRRDHRQSGLRRRARRAAGRLHDRRAADPARRAGAAPLRDRRAPLRAADRRSARRCAASAPPIAGSWSARRWCRSPPSW